MPETFSRLKPAFSKPSYVASKRMRCVGSMAFASFGVMLKNGASNTLKSCCKKWACLSRWAISIGSILQEERYKAIPIMATGLFMVAAL